LKSEWYAPSEKYANMNRAAQACCLEKRINLSESLMDLDNNMPGG